ncbi:MAG TPA: uroporphyrinogen-III synthase [Edaphocola sp.]|nr:uroporphyrinogen-III synthase [Edaphocola sp.]
MQERFIKILSTRLIDERLIEQAAADNIRIDCTGFINTHPIENPRAIEQIKFYAGQQITALFTSPNAVEAACAHIDRQPQWTIFCLSGSTKTALLKHFSEESIIAAAPNAAELIPRIMADKPLNTCVFFCGNKHLNTIPKAFLKNNMDLKEVVVYETIFSPKKINQSYDGILFFSPSAAESFFSVNKTDTKTILFSVGKTTEKAIREFTDNPVITAGFPAAENIIEDVRNYFISK